MIRLLTECEPLEVCHHGLRMTAEEYFSIGETQNRYELIDGVVIMSPSPTPLHQEIVAEIAAQLRMFVKRNPIGRVFVEVDVQLAPRAVAGELVYRPDAVYVSKERNDQIRNCIAGAPDLVVEVISPDSRRYDGETKRSDYERCGVREYWLIDPLEGRMTFYVLQGGRLVERQPRGDEFSSEALPGLVVNLADVREVFPAR